MISKLCKVALLLLPIAGMAGGVSEAAGAKAGLMKTAELQAFWWPDATGTTNDQRGSYPVTLLRNPLVTKDSGFEFTAATGQVAFAGDVLDSLFCGTNTKFSVEAWIYRTATSAASQVIVGKHADSNLGQDQRAFVLHIFSGAIRFYWVGDVNGNTARGKISGALIGTNVWSYVGATYDGTVVDASNRVSLYHNGELVATTNFGGLGSPTSIANSAAPLCIGGQKSATNIATANPFHGKIGSVAIYSNLTNFAVEHRKRYEFGRRSHQ